MLRFLHLEPCVRWTPLACLMVCVMTAWLRSSATMFDFGDLEIDPLTGIASRRPRGINPEIAYGLVMSFALQAAIVVSLRFLPVGRRIREFERALPVSARELIFTRLTATWIAFAAPAVAGCMIFVDRPFESGSFGSMLTRAIVTVSLCVVVLFAYRPRAISLRWFEVVGLGLVAGLIAVASARAWSERLDLAYGLLTLAGVVWIARRVGPAPQPHSPKIADVRSEASAASLPVRIFGPSRWTLVRSTILRPQVAFALLFGGYFIGSFSMRSPMNVWLATVMVTLALRQGLSVLQGVDALPMSRARTFNVVGMATLTVLVLSVFVSAKRGDPFPSYGVFSHGVALDGGSDDAIGAEEDEYRDHVRVPPRLWRIASTADRARVTAPWGESTDPMPHPLFFGVSTFAYCPYDVQLDNTVRFLAWQLSRALRDVRGFEGTWEDVHAEWFSRFDPERRIGAVPLGNVDLSGLATNPIDERRNAGWFAALTATLLWLVIGAVVLRPNVPSLDGSLWRHALQSDGATMAFAVAVTAPIVAVEVADRAVVPVLYARTYAALDSALSSSPWLWAALVIGVIVASWAFLQRHMRRIEVPPPMVNGWTKKPMPIY
ncbi:MAG: hypothetical protein AAF726_03855 [Planctomycetota bacterium]